MTDSEARQLFYLIRLAREAIATTDLVESVRLAIRTYRYEDALAAMQADEQRMAEQPPER